MDLFDRVRNTVTVKWKKIAEAEIILVRIEFDNIPFYYILLGKKLKRTRKLKWSLSPPGNKSRTRNASLNL